MYQLTDFTVFDDLGNNITDQTNLQVNVLSGAAHAISYNEPNCLCNNPVSLDTCFNDRPKNRSCEHGEVAIRSDCENSYTSHDSQILIHPPNQPYGIVLDLSLKTCDNGTSCVNSSDHHGLCFKSDNSFIPYEAVCNVSNQDAIYNCIIEAICGSCAADGDRDVGMIINVPSFTCIKCDDVSGASIFFNRNLLVMFMMALLAVLHINITNGNLNAYILYSQMVTLQFPGLGYSAWLSSRNLLFNEPFRYLSIPLTVYSIWNLNFLTLVSDPFCIPNIHTAVGVISLQYVIAACPLLFIIVSYTWIQCYNNGYRLVVYTTRPVHRLLARFWQKIQDTTIAN